MDLFHAVTQSIDQVLTCDWYDAFTTFKMAPADTSKTGDTSATSKTSKPVETEPGGESTQYESIKTETLPTPQQSGQLGAGSATSKHSSTSAERREQTAAKIRYGQNISESGIGGKNVESLGEAHQEGGLGGTRAEEEPSHGSRSEQGYGPGSGVGA